MTNSTVFLPSNQLTFDTVEKDNRRLLSFVDKLPSNSCLTINLEHVKKCDSAGLAFLIEAKRIAALNNRKCIIEHIDGHVLALAKFCGVESIL